MSPQHWPIVNGDKKTGVTVHVIEEDVDVGRIIDQVVINLSEEIYIHQLQREFLKVYPRIMRYSVNKCIDGYQGIEQEVNASSYYGKITTHDRTIFNSDSVKTAYGKIRAFSVPYAGAIHGDIEILKPELRIYNQPNIVTSEADIKTSLLADRFMTINLVQNQDYFNIRYQVKPFMIWIWLSVLLIIFGGFKRLFEKRYEN